jgi:hypothetical protein
MTKRKYPSELNTRTVRVNLGDWRWLNSLAQTLGITVAEAFHKVITGQDHKDKAPVSEPAQMPLQAIPTTAYRARPTTTYRAEPQTAIATNGDKAVAFRIKPRGVRYD